MKKSYHEIIKILGVIACSMLVVAAILYRRGNKTNAELALGIGASIGGIALMMYSVRSSAD